MYVFGKSPSRGARQKKYFPSNQFKTSKCLSKVVKASNQHANVPTTAMVDYQLCILGQSPSSAALAIEHI